MVFLKLVKVTKVYEVLFQNLEKSKYHIIIGAFLSTSQQHVQRSSTTRIKILLGLFCYI